MESLVTVEESEFYLSEFSNWSDLSDPIKTAHIKKASVYANVNWQSDTYDLSDSTSIPDEIKEAVAHYAYANFSGNLFQSAGSEKSYTIKSESSKAGPVINSYEYLMSSPDHTNPLSYPDSLMLVSGCVRKRGGALDRV